VTRRLAALVAVCTAFLPLPAARASSYVTLASGRRYLVAVEQRATPAAPTVVLLHGWTNTPESVLRISGFGHVGALLRWNVVSGDALTDSWNAGLCCGTAVRDRVDDVAYLVDVVASLRLRGHLGPVWLAGFSNGGMLALRAGCERPLVFDAVASVSGTLVAPCPHGIVRARHLHGTDDPVVPYRGGWSAYCRVTFPPATTEAARVVPGVDYRLVAFRGAKHAWPPGATAYLRDFFAGVAAT
jgi:poly(3-hydroxybutyrate) depolymerase